MQDRFNKPRVFLSHAWENKPFIERIAADLRRCHIDYWLDKEAIRDGRPWLKMIFEDGIPTCDAVLVYLTRESLTSKMVERELDAAVVHQLSEGGVMLLPYVSDESIRGQLRSDLQTLHCREWNDNNYDSMLPEVIAEIWHSYLESTVETAVLQEKSRRLEQELENKRLKEQFESSVFSTREEQEFEYVQRKLSNQVELTFYLFKDYRDDSRRRKIGTEVCRVSILRMLLGLMNNGVTQVEADTLGFYLSRVIGETLLAEGHEVTRGEFYGTLDSELATRTLNELQTYGLTKSHSGKWGVVYQFTDKMYRLKYWLEYTNLLTDEPLEHVVTLSLEEPQNSEQQTDEDRVTAELLAADKRIRQARLRKAWSTNGEGTRAAASDIQTMINRLRERVNKSKEISEYFKLDFHSDSNRCSITTGDVTLKVEGNCGSQHTDDCVIIVSVTAPRTELNADATDYVTVPRQIFLNRFTVKVDNNLELKWNVGDGEASSVSKLADSCWSTFIRLIAQQEENN